MQRALCLLRCGRCFGKKWVENILEADFQILKIHGYFIYDPDSALSILGADGQRVQKEEASRIKLHADTSKT